MARNVYPGAIGMAVAFKDTLNGLLSGDAPGNAGFRRTTDGGVTFTQVGAPSGMTSSNVIYVPGTKGTYVASTFDLFGWAPGSAYTRDDGLTWIPIDTKNHGRAVFISPDFGWSGGGNDSLYAWDRTGYGHAVTPVEGSRTAQPLTFLLEQNYPNPFNPTTSVRYQVSEISDVKLAVYDLLGREVAVLVNEQKAPGSYSVQFNASGLASGVYLSKLTAGNLVRTRKMMLLK